MVSSSSAAMSRMLTSSTLPPMPTFGWQEWLIRISTPSYSPGASAAKKQSAAIGNAEFPDRIGQARDGRAVHDVTAPDRDDLPARDRLDCVHAPALDDAHAALGGLAGNPRPDP